MVNPQLTWLESRPANFVSQIMDFGTWYTIVGLEFPTQENMFSFSLQKLQFSAGNWSCNLLSLEVSKLYLKKYARTPQFVYRLEFSTVVFIYDSLNAFHTLFVITTFSCMENKKKRSKQKGNFFT